MALPQPLAGAPALSRARRWALLFTVAAGLLLVTLDNSVLYTALPTLTEELSASAGQALWIINAYPLVMAGLLLGAGTLGDRIDALVVRMGRARARAAEQAELLAEMTESMDEGLVVLARDGSIERSNGASRRLAQRVRPGAPDEVALVALAHMPARAATAPRRRRSQPRDARLQGLPPFGQRRTRSARPAPWGRWAW